MFKPGQVKKKIHEITGFSLHGDAYVTQAFTRSSMKECENNEIFEMYGDSVLNFCVMQIIHEKLGFCRTEYNINYQGENGYALKGIRSECALDMIKKRLVSNEMLAAQIDKWGLTQYLIMGKSDINNHVENETKVKADLFEAILGAIAVTCNFNSEKLKSVVERMLPIDEIINEIANENRVMVPFNIDNAITVLKELSEKGILSVPQYRFFEPGAPDNLGYYENGEPVWACNCAVRNIGFIRTVFSNSKKTAKKCAAYQALCKFYEIVDEIADYQPVGKKRIVEKDGNYLIIE